MNKTSRAKFTRTLVWFQIIFVLLTLQLKSQPLVPEWAKDAIWYEIFPERFANGDTTNDPPNVQPWGGVPDAHNYFGGDLKGIIDHLGYLQRLGVNSVYLTPIFESPTNHKYHTSDYKKIDHNFGTDTTFRTLLSDLHRQQMHLIIDGVFNHSGTHFFAFEDVKKNGEKSPYAHWYNIHSFPVSPPDKPNYEAWWGLGELPKLMTDSPAVRNYLFDASSYWTKMGLDGWRLDVPNELSHDFWIQWRKLIKGINPNAYIVGEIWDDATPWLQGDQFDAVMNYRFRGACVGFIALENRTAAQFDSILQAQRAAYPAEVNYVLQNLIGSHDTERFLTLCDGDASKVKLAALVQMTYVGAPMIYYGDEIGMTGGKDPGCRGTMIWDTTKWNMDIFHWYEKLTRIRNTYDLFRRGSYATVLVDDQAKVFGFVRSGKTDKAVVLLNVGSKPFALFGKINQLGDQKWFDLLNDPSMVHPVTIDELVIPQENGMILYSPGEH